MAALTYLLALVRDKILSPWLSDNFATVLINVCFPMEKKCNIKCFCCMYSIIKQYIFYGVRKMNNIAQLQCRHMSKVNENSRQVLLLFFDTNYKQFRIHAL